MPIFASRPFPCCPLPVSAPAPCHSPSRTASLSLDVFHETKRSVLAPPANAYAKAVLPNVFPTLSDRRTRTPRLLFPLTRAAIYSPTFFKTSCSSTSHLPHNFHRPPASVNYTSQCTCTFSIVVLPPFERLLESSGGPSVCLGCYHLSIISHTYNEESLVALKFAYQHANFCDVSFSVNRTVHNSRNLTQPGASCRR